MPKDKEETHGDRGPPPHPKAPGVVRVWMDGCFDMMHFGHANAMRQARVLGHELYVGVHDDAEVLRHKGPPIMNEKERYEAVRGCKWVTHVVEGAPYVTSMEDIEKYDIDFVVHGEDITVGLDGRNSYQAVIDAGKMRAIKRTEGVSTTDIVGRMLVLTKEHHADSQTPPTDSPHATLRGSFSSKDGRDLAQAEEKHARTRMSHFLPSTRKIMQFSEGRQPSLDDKVVYVDGSFDLFHVGHINLLRKAKELGTYLIVGVYDDAVINKHRGHNFPILNLHERVLSVLACRYVDEVIMGVEYCVSEDIIEQTRASVVVAGRISDARDADKCPEKPLPDAYAVPKAKGIFVEVDSGSNLTATSIILRVLEHRMAYLKRQADKKAKDDAAVSAITGPVAEL